MPFMQAETRLDSWVQTKSDERVIPRSFCEEPDFERLGKGWGARLSAPGYLDCTDWVGPFPTENEALKALAQQYDLCPHCLDDICDPVDSSETPNLCRDAQIDALRFAAKTAAMERMRGRLGMMLTYGKTMGQQCAGQIAEAIERTEAIGDIARAMRLGIHDAQREIRAELEQLLLAALGRADSNTAVWLLWFPAGGVEEAARIRFPILFPNAPQVAPSPDR